jgi:hypothetical protein
MNFTILDLNMLPWAINFTRLQLEDVSLGNELY